MAGVAKQQPMPFYVCELCIGEKWTTASRS